MAFLTETELNTNSVQEIRNLLTAGDGVIISDIILEEIDFMKSFLRGYYDVALIFATESTDRPLVVVRFLKVLVVSRIYSSKGKEMNEEVQDEWNVAMQWLKDIQKGEVTLAPDWLLQVDTDGDGVPDEDTGYTFSGGNSNYGHDW